MSAFPHDPFPGHDDRDVLLTRAEAATYLRRSVPTLEDWARSGHGPAVVKLGRTVRYRLSDLRSWVDAGTRAAEQRAVAPFAFDVDEVGVLQRAALFGARIEFKGRAFRFDDRRAGTGVLNPLVIASLMHEGLLHDPAEDGARAGQLTAKGMELGRALLREEFGHDE